MAALSRYITTYTILGSLLLSFDCVYAEQGVDLLYEQAMENFVQGQYQETIDLMQQILQTAPDESAYHHLLGKAYGRAAEEASWMKAMSYAKKCLKSFQQAVMLDDKNINALKDLKSYYEQAPGFLGGSKKKAKAIESKLSQLEQTY